MRKNALEKHSERHTIDASTSHRSDEEMEIAQEFFDQELVRPLDYQGTLADNLTQKIKNDSQD